MRNVLISFFLFLTINFSSRQEFIKSSCEELIKFSQQDLQYVGRSGRCANGEKWTIDRSMKGITENGLNSGVDPIVGQIYKIRGRCFILSREEGNHGFSALVYNVYSNKI